MNKLINKCDYYPASLNRVQITLQMSTNISPYFLLQKTGLTGFLMSHMAKNAFRFPKVIKEEPDCTCKLRNNRVPGVKSPEQHVQL